MKTAIFALVLLGILIITPLAVGYVTFPTSLRALKDIGTLLTLLLNIARFWITIIIDGFQAIKDALLHLSIINWLTILVSAIPPIFFGCLKYRNSKK